MSEPSPIMPSVGELPAISETTLFILATFSDLHRQELAAEEDVYRTLPFFGTALGVVVAALAYAAGHLPKWSDISSNYGVWGFSVAAALLMLTIIEAGCVLVWLSRAVTLRPYQRIGPEQALRERLDQLITYYDNLGIDHDKWDDELLKDMRQALIDSYVQVTPINRAFNVRRYKFRAKAASHLIRSLIWALGATTVIIIWEKLI